MFVTKETDVVISTPRCTECGETSFVVVNKEAYQKWCGGLYIQDAFPDWSPAQREMLITGTHPECWKKIFADEEEDGD